MVLADWPASQTLAASAALGQEAHQVALAFE